MCRQGTFTEYLLYQTNEAGLDPWTVADLGAQVGGMLLAVCGGRAPSWPMGMPAGHVKRGVLPAAAAAVHVPDQWGGMPPDRLAQRVCGSCCQWRGGGGGGGGGARGHITGEAPHPPLSCPAVNMVLYCRPC